MDRFVCFALLLGASWAADANFSSVYEWNKLDFDWPSESIRQDAVKDRYKQEQIQPRYMAASHDRLFLSLRRQYGLPATLVSLPTRSTSKSPKFAPFPAWEASTYENCSAMQQPKSLQLDSRNRLWVLDDGDQGRCAPKLWVFDLADDSVALVHQFPEDMFQTSTDSWKSMNDLAVNEVADDWLAFVADARSEQLVVFSFARNESWSVETGGVGLQSLVLAPNGQLFASEFRANKLFTISAAQLADGRRSVDLLHVGDWSSRGCYRALSGRDGVLYAAFYEKNFIRQFDSNAVFKEESFYEEGKTLRTVGRMFSFSIDPAGTFWLLVTNEIAGQKFYKLLKTTLGTQTYLSNAPQPPQKMKDFCKENGSVCKNGGVCVNLSEQEGGYLCDCPANLSGYHCETPNDEPILFPTTETKPSVGLRASNESSVFEWDTIDFNWPSERSREQALKDGTFQPGKLPPFYLAVYDRRILLSFSRYEGVPVTLAWLPTTSAFSASPKLSPYPFWQMQKAGCCSVLQDVRGLQVDSLGRLWAVDNGLNDKCRAKLWIFNMAEHDKLERVHEFPEHVVPRDSPRWLTELVLDETPDDSFAYIADSSDSSTRLVVFSFRTRRSWRVQTHFRDIEALALSPLRQSRQHLYFGGLASQQLHAVLVSDLRSGVLDPVVKFVGNKTALSRRMAMDTHGRLYFDLVLQKSIASWDTNVPFEEKNFYTLPNVIDYWPFLFTFDEGHNLWLMTITSSPELSYKLFKVAVGSEHCSDCHASSSGLANRFGGGSGCREQESAMCRNGGACVRLSEQDGNFRCDCTQSFFGHHCQVPKNPLSPPESSTDKKIEVIVENIPSEF